MITPIVGQTLGHYKIEAELGAGGMGVVYRAADSKLGRQVAIKVLPEAFAKDPERLARFKREAQMLAALNHPNIAGIHGIEEAAGVHYLVLELAPGETLAERLKHGALEIPEALGICRQIAEVLEAAHDRGIIHRDLKPPNVKITPGWESQGAGFRIGESVSGERWAGPPGTSPTGRPLCSASGLPMPSPTTITTSLHICSKPGSERSWSTADSEACIAVGICFMSVAELCTRRRLTRRSWPRRGLPRPSSMASSRMPSCP